MDTWKDLAEIINNTVQAVALVVGGIWAYFKFFRGRTFANRAEVYVAGALYKFDSDLFVRVTIGLKNTGVSKISLEPQTSAVYLFGIESEGYSPGANIKWKKQVRTPVLESHRWVEGQETITDDVLIPTPHPNHSSSSVWLAYRLQARVWGKKRRFRKGGTRWAADAIVPAEVKLLHQPKEAQPEKEPPPAAARNVLSSP
jgi:hypothetical protein